MADPLREARMELFAATILNCGRDEGAFRPAGEIREPSAAAQRHLHARRPLSVSSGSSPLVSSRFPCGSWHQPSAAAAVDLKLGQAPGGLHVAGVQEAVPPGVHERAHGRRSRARPRSSPTRSPRDLVRIVAGRPFCARRGNRARLVQLELGGHNPLISSPQGRARPRGQGGLRRCVLVRRASHRDASDPGPEEACDAFREKLLTRATAG